MKHGVHTGYRELGLSSDTSARSSGRPSASATNTRLAGEVADGWIPTLFSPEHVAEFRPLLEKGAALSDELIDAVSLVGPREHVGERVPVYRDAGVSPPAFTKGDRLEQLRLIAELAS